MRRHGDAQVMMALGMWAPSVSFGLYELDAHGFAEQIANRNRFAEAWGLVAKLAPGIAIWESNKRLLF